MEIKFSAALIGAVGENFSLLYSYHSRNHRKNYSIDSLCPEETGRRIGIELSKEDYMGPITVTISNSPKEIASFGSDMNTARSAVGNLQKGIQTHWEGKILVEE